MTNNEEQPDSAVRQTVQLHQTDDSVNIRENFGNVRDQVRAQKALNQAMNGGAEAKSAKFSFMQLFASCIKPKN